MEEACIFLGGKWNGFCGWSGGMGEEQKENHVGDGVEKECGERQPYLRGFR